MATKTKRFPKLSIPADAPKQFIPITEQRFRTEFTWYDQSYSEKFELEVIVMTAAEWLEFPGRVYCDWGAQTLGNGMIIAARMVPGGEQRKQMFYRSQDQINDTEHIAALRFFQNRFLAFLENDPDLNRVELSTSGDAECEFQINYNGHEQTIVVDVSADYDN